MRLSVIIPTISARASTLSRSLWHLIEQPGDFEVIVHRGDEIGLGDKVNAMIAEARGDYIVQVDDDDHLPLGYMASVLPFLDGSVDAVGYKILALRDGSFWVSIAHDPTHEFGVDTPRPDGSIGRGVCNKIPIRRELAQKVHFGNAYTDDWPWSEQVHRLVERSTFIDRHLYVYDWWPSTMAFRNADRRPHGWTPQRDIGAWPYDSERIRWM